MIWWLREERFSSKSEAAEWGEANLKGEWRFDLGRCKELRLMPIDVDQKEVKDWLDGLFGAIQAAADELKSEIRIKKNRINCQ